MGAGKVLPGKGIKVTLDGKPRILRFTMYSLAWLADKHGSVNAVLDIFSKIDATGGGEMSADTLHSIADLVCASLMYDDKEITPQYVEENLDIADIIDIMPDLIQAFMQSMGNGEGKKKNPPKA